MTFLSLVFIFSCLREIEQISKSNVFHVLNEDCQQFKTMILLNVCVCVCWCCTDTSLESYVSVNVRSRALTQAQVYIT